MLADENLELRPELAGRRHQHAEQQCGEQQLDLERLTPAAAEIADKIAGGGDCEQEGARHQKSRCVEHHATRHVQFDRPAGIARRGNREKWNDQRIGETARNENAGLEPAEHHRFGIEEDVERECAGETHAQGFQRPARLRERPPEQLLDQEEPEDCDSQAQCVFGRSALGAQHLRAEYPF